MFGWLAQGASQKRGFSWQKSALWCRVISLLVIVFTLVTIITTITINNIPLRHYTESNAH